MTYDDMRRAEGGFGACVCILLVWLTVHLLGMSFNPGGIVGTSAVYAYRIYRYHYEK